MKKIAVVTATRAEYGLLKPLISALEKHENFQLLLFVTGMHLLPKFGNTYKEIENDGFSIAAKVYDDLSGDSSKAIVQSLAKVTEGFSTVFETHKPDLIVVLGDRSEILAVVMAAIIFNIPIAHIRGGETTEGAYDEFIRHAITKMSHLHFASTETYRKRIIQMGEHPSRAFNVGEIGIDSIKKLTLLTKREFEDSIAHKIDRNFVLITFHPVTLEKATAKEQFSELIQALDTLEATTLLFTKPNSDKDGQAIVDLIDSYVSQNPKKAVAFTSLGQLRYLSAASHATFVIGNSSSGISEVPYFNVPTINIGDRQKGRIMAKSVINCKPMRNDIVKAIKFAMSKPFKTKIQNQEQLYGNGQATSKIMHELLAFDYTEIQKKFYDVKFPID
ncbi:UDP-N-acetylglucosamine 2-epimerase [Ulvibacterium sp.]|uniref:UDP-N-acetylglucosamine 2-epimerase n=1 Tax=Ulvibacterium sp. TaxID=2665914 RepID=UPI003CC50EE7